MLSRDERHVPVVVTACAGRVEGLPLQTECWPTGRGQLPLIERYSGDDADGIRDPQLAEKERGSRRSRISGVACCIRTDSDAVVCGDRHHRRDGCASADPKMPNSSAARSAVSAASSSEHSSVITAVSLMRTCTDKRPDPWRTSTHCRSSRFQKVWTINASHGMQESMAIVTVALVGDRKLDGRRDRLKKQRCRSEA
jgi:hypothetical protein